MITIALRIALAALAVYAAWHRETMSETDLRHDDKPGASAAGLPPDSPDGPESTYSVLSVREPSVLVLPTPPMPPFFNYTAQQIPMRRQHNWAAQMATGNGRDAGWMEYAAAQAARVQRV